MRKITTLRARDIVTTTGIIDLLMAASSEYPESQSLLSGLSLKSAGVTQTVMLMTASSAKIRYDVTASRQRLRLTFGIQTMSNYQNAYQPPQSVHGGNRSTSGLAIASLILGLASFICAIFTGLIAIILGIVALLKISNSNGRVVGNGFAIAGIVTGAMGCLWTLVMIGMLLPAVQQVRTAARRVTAMNNVRQLCLASLNHESTHGRFPSNLSADNPDAGENLSWRVHLLPFLGKQDLYNQFKLDEPWDSPNNKALLSQMPEQFQNPQLQVDFPEGYTVFHMPSSPANSETPSILVEGERGVSFNELTDGSMNTILILEVSELEAVPWTKPQDWQFDPDNPTRGVGDAFPGTFVTGMCDGSTHTMDRSISAETLKPLLTRSAGDTPPAMY